MVVIVINKIDKLFKIYNIKRYKIVEHKIDKINLNGNQLNENTRTISTTNKNIIYFDYMGGLGKLEVELFDIMSIKYLINSCIKNKLLNYDLNINKIFTDINTTGKQKIIEEIRGKPNIKNIELWLKKAIQKATKECLYNNYTYKFIFYMHSKSIYGDLGLYERTSSIKNDLYIEVTYQDEVYYEKYDNIKLYDEIKLKPFVKENDTNTIQYKVLEDILSGNVRISSYVLKKIFSLLPDVFNYTNIISNKVFIKSNDMNKKLFNIDIDIIDDPIHNKNNNYDDTGNLVSKIHLINKGVIKNLYVDEFSDDLFSETNGNVYFTRDNKNMNVSSSFIIINFNLPKRDNYTIYIDEITEDEFYFDYYTGNIKMSLIGEKKYTQNRYKYNIEYNIVDLLNSAISISTDNIDMGDFSIPDVIFSII